LPHMTVKTLRVIVIESSAYQKYQRFLSLWPDFMGIILTYAVAPNPCSAPAA
jgi:hypothetical protein